MVKYPGVFPMTFKQTVVPFPHQNKNDTFETEIVDVRIEKRRPKEIVYTETE